MTREVRSRMRDAGKASRLELSAAEREAYSRRIATHLLALLDRQRLTSVALFWAITGSGEVDLQSLDETLRRRGATRFYPFQERTPQGLHRGFRQLRPQQTLPPQGTALFAQPDSQAPVARAGQIDLIVVPALVATRRGERLGYGSGFYDQVLPTHCPPAQSVIAAFEAQCVTSLPPRPGDVRCDGVVTEQGAYGLNPSRR